MLNRSEKPKVGIAMIARNAEEMIPRALDPLVDYADEIAIVLGGMSQDDTKRVAMRYATIPVEEFTEEVDWRGRLTNFAKARQMSFDLLEEAGCEWAIYVDTDEVWSRVENLESTIERAHFGHFAMVYLPLTLNGGQSLMPRIYRIDSGVWEGKCHNQWILHNEKMEFGMKTGMVCICQESTLEKDADRRDQNIRIMEEELKKGDRQRYLFFLARSYIHSGRGDEALDLIERYIDRYPEDYENRDELCHAYVTRSTLYMGAKEYRIAWQSAMDALAVMNFGPAYTVAADALIGMASEIPNPQAFLELALFCTDQALASGKPRSIFWSSPKATSSVACRLKAQILIAMDRRKEALAALDLGLLVDPDDQAMQQMRVQTSNCLGEVI